MATARYNFEVSQEIIDDWAAFDAYAMAYIRRELESIFIAEAEKIDNEFMNGSGDGVPGKEKTR